MFEKRRRARSKCNNGIRDRGLRRELRLGRKETFYEGLGQIIGLGRDVSSQVFHQQLESNHREKLATGKEGGADHRRQKYSPWKRRNDGMPVGYSQRIALRRE
jgi:hypothetical protein